MKNDIILNERIYRLLKSQIDCGILPAGTKLPSREELCGKLCVSAKTVRRVLEKLAEDGLIETQKRKRPVVKARAAGESQGGGGALPAPGAVTQDVLVTGRLLCYPVIEKGAALCAEEDWDIPAAILARMEPRRGIEFWRLSHRFWRFFVARNENDLILRAADSLGFFDRELPPGPLELRERYLGRLQSFVQAARQDGRVGNDLLRGLAELYGTSKNEDRYAAAADPAHTGLYGLEQRLRSAEERYSHVYMDILGLIAVGRYRPGDRLPPHKELQAIYEVSSDTTAKAIRVLQKWGVVTAKRGDGIYVAMDLAGLKNAKIPPELIGCHLRRFLDSLELLSLTVEGVAEHAAAFVSAEEARRFEQNMERAWNEEYLYQLTPMLVLDFITGHIQFPALKEIYRVVAQNYHIGRSIPKLVTEGKTPRNLAIHRQAAEAVECLARGEAGLFSKKASAMFRYVQELVLEECTRLDYRETAEKVYDGTVLWKKTYFLSTDPAWQQ